MNAKQLFPKTYKQYSKGGISKEQLPDVALDEAKERGFGKKHRIKKAFLTSLLFGTRTIGYSATAVVGASVLVPGFLSFDMMLSKVQPAFKYLYAYSFIFGATGLGLTSYYIGRTTHKIAKALSEKITLLKTIEQTTPEDAVEVFMDEINKTKQNPK